MKQYLGITGFFKSTAREDDDDDDDDDDDGDDDDDDDDDDGDKIRCQDGVMTLPIKTKVSFFSEGPPLKQSWSQ